MFKVSVLTQKNTSLSVFTFIIVTDANRVLLTVPQLFKETSIMFFLDDQNSFFVSILYVTSFPCTIA